MKRHITILIFLLLANSAFAVVEFGNIGGANVKATLYDCNGAEVTFELKTAGYGQIIDDCNFGLIELYDTTEKSTFFIKTLGRGVETSVGDIIVYGPMGNISAKTTDLRGNIEVQGTLKKLEMDDVADDHLLTIGSSSDPLAAVTLKFDQVNDLSIGSLIPIKSLTVTEWIDANGSSVDQITAPSIDMLKVKGDRRRAIAGDFGANVSLTGSIDANKPTLKNGRIFGALTGIIDVNGHLGNLSVNQLRGDLLVHGNARNIRLKESVALTPGQEDLGQLIVDGYARISCYKDRIKGSDCNFYSRSSSCLYPLEELQFTGDPQTGDWWRYYVEYIVRAFGMKEEGSDYDTISITDVYTDGLGSECIEFTESVAGTDVSYTWCVDTNGVTRLTAWDIAVDESGSTMDFSLVMDVNLTSECFQMRQRYCDEGTFDGDFSAYDPWYGTIDGYMYGTVKTCSRLAGHEEVDTPLGLYMTAKYEIKQQIRGTIVLNVPGYGQVTGRFSASADQRLWSVPDLGPVKMEVRNMKVRVSAPGAGSATVYMKQSALLDDYGPK